MFFKLPATDRNKKVNTLKRNEAEGRQLTLSKLPKGIDNLGAARGPELRSRIALP
jgi:hypothetical protein